MVVKTELISFCFYVGYVFLFFLTEQEPIVNSSEEELHSNYSETKGQRMPYKKGRGARLKVEVGLVHNACRGVFF